MRRAIQCTWLGLIVGLLVVSSGCEATSAPADLDCEPASLSIVAPLDGAEIRPVHDNDDAPGIQADVRVETSLAPGSSLSLSIVQQGKTVDTVGTVGLLGDAVFASVTLPSGQVTLQVQDDGCSGAVAEASAFVYGNARCSLELEHGGQENAYYKPLPVANASDDEDPDVPGFQTTAEIRTDPGYAVELVVLDGRTWEETVFDLPADDSGELSELLTLGEGVQTVAANCLAPDGAITPASGGRTFVVDTVPPTCSFTEPAADAHMTVANDADPSRDGTQVPLAAQFVGDDVAGKSVSFVMRSAGYALVAPAAEIDADGVGSVTGTLWVPGLTILRASASDYADNPCLAERTVSYE